ncbi:hypothetical protein LCGC14_1653870 [marine sediment metagenome]|uniref:Uncharacterized protein n=1 Tax=marine sediment metagenome TaxID=412755 RepID=A0A0F9IIN4_9ZZZZ
MKKVPQEIMLDVVDQNGNNGVAEVDLASRVDNTGYVFHWEGGIYRAIRKQHSPEVRRILTLPNFQKVFDAGLIDTKIVKHPTVKNYGTVLQHKRIDFPSYHIEWTPDMMRDGLLMLIDLGEELAKHGLELYDNHTYNTFFDFSTPKYIDFGSMGHMRTGFPRQWAGYIKQFWLDRRLFKTTNLTEADYLKIRSSENVALYCKQMREWLLSAEFSYSPTEWSGYGQKRFGQIGNLPPKQEEYLRFIQECREAGAETLLDIGANQGVYSVMAETLGYKVVAFDIDQTSIAKLYRHVKTNGLNILPIIFDFSKPTEAHGLYTKGYTVGHERFACDVTVALALTHHMSYKQRVDFDTYAERTSQFTKRFAMVEFVPPEDKHIAGWPNKPPWYTIENLIKSMMKHFDTVEILPCNPEPRKLLVFEKWQK